MIGNANGATRRESLNLRECLAQLALESIYSAASLAPLLFFLGASAFFSTGARNLPV